MDAQIITNNPMAKDALSGRFPVVFLSGSYLEVLTHVRDLVHKGHKLYTHPLSGSVKPGETPYKSIAVSAQPGSTDFDSVQIIEAGIAACLKFPIRHTGLPEKVLSDFQTVDHALITGALTYQLN